jgi:Protein of unknown function (DUF1761)
MNRVNFLALAVISVIAFFASSIWYSPLMFGRLFLELSGVAASHPSVLKALCELLRTFILAYVIARLMLRLNVADWKDALGVGLWLWIGLPVILLTGSMLWQNVPWQLAAIHAGDWLIKLILIPVGVTLWPNRTRVRNPAQAGTRLAGDVDAAALRGPSTGSGREGRRSTGNRIIDRGNRS